MDSTTDPTGVTTTYDHDVEGRVTAVIDEDGNATETGYDPFGRAVEVTDPLGETTTTTYDADGRVAEVEDREAHATTYEFDAAGRQYRVTDARGGETETTFTPAGRVASVTDATGRTTTYRYDTAGRRVEVEAPSGATMTTGYDLDGRVATVTSPEGRVTTYGYDDVGRTTSGADPRSGTTATTYTASGQVEMMTDATGGEVVYGYTDGQLTSVTDPLDATTTYGYDSRGNRVLRTDALAGEREWHYDLADRLTSEVDPLNRTTTIVYDDLGRVDVRTDGAGRTTTYGYDEAGKVTSLTYASGTPTTFGYDDEGRRTSIVDATGTTTFSYGATGLVTGVNATGARDVALAWDLAGRRTVVTYPDGTQYRNRYDPDGQVSEVERLVSGVWTDVAVNSYDDDGLLVGQDQGAAGTRSWDHDPLTGLLDTYEEVRGATTTTTTLGYDAAGRITSEATGGLSAAYDYDDAGQLASVDRNVGADEAYTYDALGRRATSTLGGVASTYTFDAASQLTSRVVGGDTHSYQYDASGRRVREAWNSGASVLQWFWGVRGFMTGQRSTVSGTVTDISRATRGDGVVTTLTTAVGGSTTDTTSLVWDPTTPGVAQPIWTGTPSTSNATRAVYGPDLIRVDCPTGTGCTGPVAHDVYGSALETTAVAARTQASAHDAYGQGGPFATGASYGYRGELTVGTLVHLRARDYDPATGTFLSPDPLDGIDGTTTVANPYHYVDNDPLNAIDPTGLRPNDCAAGAKCSVVLEEFEHYRPSDPEDCFGASMGIYRACSFEEESVDAANRAGIDPVLLFGTVINETTGGWGNAQGPMFPEGTRGSTGPANLPDDVVGDIWNDHSMAITNWYRERYPWEPGDLGPGIAFDRASTSLVFAAFRLGDLWDEVYEVDRANTTVDVVATMSEVRGSFRHENTKVFAMSAVIHVGYLTARAGPRAIARMLTEHDWDDGGTGSSPKSTHYPDIVTSELSGYLCDAADRLHMDHGALDCGAA